MQIRKSINFVMVLVLTTLACVSGVGPSSTQATEEPNASTLETATSLVVVETSTPVHQMTPNELPELQSGAVGDQDSSISAEEKRAPSGDRFTFSRFERPFNADTMDTYYSFLDIQGALFYEDDAWLYSVIVMKTDEANQAMNGKYGFEIDVDVDGRVGVAR